MRWHIPNCPPIAAIFSKSSKAVLVSKPSRELAKSSPSFVANPERFCYAPGQWTINYTEHEYCEILQGVSVLRDAQGNGKTLRAGDRFVIPAGLKGTWEVLEPCRKVYVIFEAKALSPTEHSIQSHPD